MTTSPIVAGLSQPQILALSALAKGSSVVDAAAAAGVHRCTVHTWCAGHELFRATLDTAQRIHMERVLDHHRALVDSAAAALRDLIEDPGTPASVRLKAALSVLTTVAAAKPAVSESFFLDNQPPAAAEPPPEPASPVTQSIEPAVELALAEPTPDTAPSPATACLCGSGKKFWRCCLVPDALPATRAA